LSGEDDAVIADHESSTNVKNNKEKFNATRNTNDTHNTPTEDI
jgi:hypothetical protein